MTSEAKYKATKETGVKILTPKQMLQRLPIALPQVKAGNNSESLLNEIREIVYSLYQSKQITKKVYNNINESILLHTYVYNGHYLQIHRIKDGYYIYEFRKQ